MEYPTSEDLSTMEETIIDPIQSFNSKSIGAQDINNESQAEDDATSKSIEGSIETVSIDEKVPMVGDGNDGFVQMDTSVEMDTSTVLEHDSCEEIEAVPITFIGDGEAQMDTSEIDAVKETTASVEMVDIKETTVLSDTEMVDISENSSSDNGVTGSLNSKEAILSMDVATPCTDDIGQIRDPIFQLANTILEVNTLTQADTKDIVTNRQSSTPTETTEISESTSETVMSCLSTVEEVPAGNDVPPWQVTEHAIVEPETNAEIPSCQVLKETAADSEPVTNREMPSWQVCEEAPISTITGTESKQPDLSASEEALISATTGEQSEVPTLPLTEEAAKPGDTEATSEDSIDNECQMEALSWQVSEQPTDNQSHKSETNAEIPSCQVLLESAGDSEPVTNREMASWQVCEEVPISTITGTEIEQPDLSASEVASTSATSGARSEVPTLPLTEEAAKTEDTEATSEDSIHNEPQMEAPSWQVSEQPTGSQSHKSETNTEIPSCQVLKETLGDSEPVTNREMASWQVCEEAPISTITGTESEQPDLSASEEASRSSTSGAQSEVPTLPLTEEAAKPGDTKATSEDSIDNKPQMETPSWQVSEQPTDSQSHTSVTNAEIPSCQVLKETAADSEPVTNREMASWQVCEEAPIFTITGTESEQSDLSASEEASKSASSGAQSEVPTLPLTEEAAKPGDTKATSEDSIDNKPQMETPSWQVSEQPTDSQSHTSVTNAEIPSYQVLKETAADSEPVTNREMASWQVCEEAPISTITGTESEQLDLSASEEASKSATSGAQSEVPTLPLTEEAAKPEDTEATSEDSIDNKPQMETPSWQVSEQPTDSQSHTSVTNAEIPSCQVLLESAADLEPVTNREMAWQVYEEAPISTITGTESEQPDLSASEEASKSATSGAQSEVPTLSLTEEAAKPEDTEATSEDSIDNKPQMETPSWQVSEQPTDSQSHTSVTNAEIPSCQVLLESAADSEPVTNREMAWQVYEEAPISTITGTENEQPDLSASEEASKSATSGAQSEVPTLSLTEEAAKPEDTEATSEDSIDNKPQMETPSWQVSEQPTDSQSHTSVTNAEIPSCQVLKETAADSEPVTNREMASWQVYEEAPISTITGTESEQPDLSASEEGSKSATTGVPSEVPTLPLTEEAAKPGDTEATSEDSIDNKPQMEAPSWQVSEQPTDSQSHTSVTNAEIPSCQVLKETAVDSEPVTNREMASWQVYEEAPISTITGTESEQPDLSASEEASKSATSGAQSEVPTLPLTEEAAKPEDTEATSEDSIHNNCQMEAPSWQVSEQPTDSQSHMEIPSCEMASENALEMVEDVSKVITEEKLNTVSNEPTDSGQALSSGGSGTGNHLSDSLTGQTSGKEATPIAIEIDNEISQLEVTKEISKPADTAAKKEIQPWQVLESEESAQPADHEVEKEIPPWQISDEASPAQDAEETTESTTTIATTTATTASTIPFGQPITVRNTSVNIKSRPPPPSNPNSMQFAAQYGQWQQNFSGQQAPPPPPPPPPPPSSSSSQGTYKNLQDSAKAYAQQGYGQQWNQYAQQSQQYAQQYAQWSQQYTQYYGQQYGQNYGQQYDQQYRHYYPYAPQYGPGYNQGYSAPNTQNWSQQPNNFYNYSAPVAPVPLPVNTSVPPPAIMPAPVTSRNFITVPLKPSQPGITADKTLISPKTLTPLPKVSTDKMSTTSQLRQSANRSKPHPVSQPKPQLVNRPMPKPVAKEEPVVPKLTKEQIAAKLLEKARAKMNLEAPPMKKQRVEEPVAGCALPPAADDPTSHHRHLCIGNLPQGTKATALRDMLTSFGKVIMCKIAAGKGANAGIFAFVTMECIVDVSILISSLNGWEFNGVKLTAKKLKNPPVVKSR